jgi:phage-related minor tail protein
MAAEIVGTAYVRIRAITTSLASEINDGVEKGAKDAKIDKAGEKLGRDLSTGIGDGVETGAPDVINRLDDELEKSGGKRTEKRGNWLGRKIMKGMGEGVDNDSPGFLSKFQGALKKIEGLADKLKLPGIAWTGLIGLSLLNSVVAVAGAVLGTLVAQLGYVATAAVGAGAAIIGAVGALSFAAAPIALAFKAETPELAEFKKFASDVSQVWAEVGKSTQKYLLPGLTAAITSSANLIPIFKVFGEQVGKIVGDFAAFNVEVLTSNRNAGPWTKTLMTSASVLKSLGTAITFLLDGALSFFAAASPIAIEFAGSLAKGAQSFNEFVRAGEASGSLQTTLQKFYDRAKLIGGALLDVSAAIWNVFKIGADTAQPFFDVLSETAAKWRVFTQTPEGIAKIQEIFINMQPVMREVNLLLKEIIGYILEPALTGDTAGMLSFLRVIRTDLLPVFKDLADSLSGQITDNLVVFVTEFAKLVKVGSDTGALSAFFGTFTQALSILTSLLALPGVGEFIAKILTLAGTFKAFMLVLGPIVSVLTPVVTAIASFVGLSGGLSGIAAAIGAVATGAVPLGAGLVAIISPILSFIAVCAAVVGAVIAVVYAFNNWDKITEFVARAWTAVTGFFSNLPENLKAGAEALWTWIQDAIPTALEALGRWGAAIISWLSGLPGLILNWLGDAISALSSWIVAAVPGVLSALADFGLYILNWFVDFLIALPGFLIDGAKALVSFVIDAIPFLIENLGNIAGAIWDFAKSLPGKIATFFQGAGDAFWAWIQDAGPGILDRLNEIFGKLGDALGKLPGLIGGWVADAASALWEWITGAGPGVSDGLLGLLSTIGNWALSLPGMILGWLGGAISALWGWIVQAGPTILAKLGGIALTIGQFLLTLPGKILGWLGGAISALWGWIVDAAPIILEKLGYAIGFVAGFLLSLPVKIGYWLASAAAALWQWIVDAVPVALEWLGNLASNVFDWVVNFVSELPGRLLGAVEALWNWIKEAAPKALAKLGEFALSIWNWVTGFVSELPGRILSAAVALYNWISDAVRELPGKLAEFAGKIWDWITGFIADLPGKFTSAIDKMASIGGDLVRGIWNGIKDLGKWILDKISGFAGDVIDGFKDAFGINSPSKMMMPIGSGITEGIQVGMESALGLVQSAANKLVKAATPDLNDMSMSYKIGVDSTALSTLNGAKARMFGSLLATTPAAASAATVEAARAAAVAAVQETNLSLLVKIGDRDITDIVDARVSDNDFATAQAIYRTTKG